MHISSFDSVFPEALPQQLPWRLEQRTSLASGLLRLAVLLPAVAVMLVPFGMVAAQGIADSETRAAIAANPLSAAQLLAGMAMWLALFALPLKRTVETLARSRVVEVADGMVTVRERSINGSREWRAPLASFAGVAHNIRTSLSGVRHELVLVSRDPARSVLVAVAPRIAEAEIAGLAALLGRPVVARPDRPAAAAEPFALDAARA